MSETGELSLRWKVPRDAIIPPLKKGSILTVSLLRATANRGLEVLGVRDERWLNGEYVDTRCLPFARKGYYLKICYEIEGEVACVTEPRCSGTISIHVRESGGTITIPTR